MGFSEIILLHKTALEQLLNYWPVALFVFLGEILLILKSRQFTRRGAIEASLSTAIPFLLVFWGLSMAPESTTNKAKEVPLIELSIWLPVILSVAGIMIRSTILQIFFQTRTIWEFIASAPLPLFVYFTGWIALK